MLSCWPTTAWPESAGPWQGQAESAPTLTRLARDRSAGVRWSVLVFHPERLDLAEIIATDSDEMNACQARAQLRNPQRFTLE